MSSPHAPFYNFSDFSPLGRALHFGPVEPEDGSVEPGSEIAAPKANKKVGKVRPNLTVSIPKHESDRGDPFSNGPSPFVGKLGESPLLPVAVSSSVGSYQSASSHEESPQESIYEISVDQNQPSKANWSGISPYGMVSQTGDDAAWSSSSSPVENCMTCNPKLVDVDFEDTESEDTQHYEPSAYSLEIERISQGDPEWRRFYERQRWIRMLEASAIEDENHEEYFHLYEHDPDSPVDWKTGECSCFHSPRLSWETRWERFWCFSPGYVDKSHYCHSPNERKVNKLKAAVPAALLNLIDLGSSRDQWDSRCPLYSIDNSSGWDASDEDSDNDLPITYAELGIHYLDEESGKVGPRRRSLDLLLPRRSVPSMYTRLGRFLRGHLKMCIVGAGLLLLNSAMLMLLCLFFVGF